jgi:hypothetical protein
MAMDRSYSEKRRLKNYYWVGIRRSQKEKVAEGNMEKDRFG